MNGSPVNGPRAAADMRDVQAVRELVEAEVHRSALFRAEVRARHAREDERARLVDAKLATMLRHLERLVDVPAAEAATLPPTWAARARLRLDSPASTRAVLALACAGILASLASCAYPVAHMIGAIP